MAGHSKWANIKHRKAAADAKKGKVFTRLIKEITVAARLGGAEGYGPGGAAVLVDCLTDNRTRTVAEVRHAFTKNGGNLGADGSVAYLFKHCGQFIFAPGTSEDRVMEAALDAGAEDVLKNDDDSVELICAPADFDAVKAALDKAGLKPELSEVTWKPTMETALPSDQQGRMRSLVDALENLDDVQNVHTTAVID